MNSVTRPLSVSKVVPIGICTGSLSVTNLLLPGSLYLTVPLARLMLTVLPATGGGSGQRW